MKRKYIKDGNPALFSFFTDRTYAKFSPMWKARWSLAEDMEYEDIPGEVLNIQNFTEKVNVVPPEVEEKINPSAVLVTGSDTADRADAPYQIADAANPTVDPVTGAVEMLVKEPPKELVQDPPLPEQPVVGAGAPDTDLPPPKPVERDRDWYKAYFKSKGVQYAGNSKLETLKKKYDAYITE